MFRLLVFVLNLVLLSTSLRYGDVCSSDRKLNMSSRFEPFRFVVYGDSGGSYHFQNTVHGQLLQGMMDLDPRPDFILHCGDALTSRIDKESNWDSLFSDIDQVCDEIPFFFAYGNHDSYLSSWSAHLQLSNRGHYSFNWKEVHFVVLDTTSKQQNNVQLNWLREDLENTDPHDFVFGLQHHTRVSTGEEGCFPQTVALDDILMDRAVAIFSGHSHDYERFGKTAPFFFVTGGGGSYLSDERHHPEMSRVYKAEYHFMVVDVLSTHEINFTSIAYDGRILDAVSYDSHRHIDPNTIPSCERINSKKSAIFTIFVVLGFSVTFFSIMYCLARKK
jgi:hypothetical protein